MSNETRNFELKGTESPVTQSYIEEISSNSETEEAAEPALAIEEIKEIQDPIERATQISRKLTELDNGAKFIEATPIEDSRWVYLDRQDKEQLGEMENLVADVMGESPESAYNLVADVARNRIIRGMKKGLNPESSLYPVENPLKPGEQLTQDVFGNTYDFGNTLMAVEEEVEAEYRD